MKKLKLYQEALKILEACDPKKYMGFCHAFTTVLLKEVDTYEKVLSNHRELFDNVWNQVNDIIYGRNPDFPELVLYKPENTQGSSYWFDPKDKETRINILKEIIEKLKSEGETE